MIRRLGGAVVLTAVLSLSISAARADDRGAPPAGGTTSGGGAATSRRPLQATSQGVAVVALRGAREEGFAAARAIYASRQRPRALDEVRARVLAGDAPPANATRELRDLAELRAAVAGEDAASRRLLSAIAQQIHVAAILVVSPPSASPPAPAVADGGADAAAAETAEPSGVEGVATGRLFLASTGEFDAARYAADRGIAGPTAWKGAVASIDARLPEDPSRAVEAGRAAPTMKPPLSPDPAESKPFYSSAWFWGALGAAALLGGAFYFASRDASDDSIHLQMRGPR